MITADDIRRAEEFRRARIETYQRHAFDLIGMAKDAEVSADQWRRLPIEKVKEHMESGVWDEAENVAYRSGVV